MVLGGIDEGGLDLLPAQRGNWWKMFKMFQFLGRVDLMPLLLGMLLGCVMGFMLNIPGFAACLVSMGVGHGSYDASRALYPHACAILEARHGRIDFVVVTVALIQYPIYGMIVGAAGRLFQTSRDRLLGLSLAFVLLLAHACCVAFYGNIEL